MCAWIVVRERGGSIQHKVSWGVQFLWWGNIAVALYMLKALTRTGTAVGAFFLRRQGGATDEERVPGTLGKLLCVVGALGSAVVLVRGLGTIGFSSVPAFGYIAGFGTPIYHFLVMAFVPNRR